MELRDPPPQRIFFLYEIESFYFFIPIPRPRKKRDEEEEEEEEKDQERWERRKQGGEEEG